MSATVLDGKAIAAEIRAELKTAVSALINQGVTPGLGVILVGEDPASVSYVTAKERACAEIGIYSDDNRVPGTATQDDLLALIDTLNGAAEIDGILLQLPLPDHLDESAALLAIDPGKDVDGLHPVNAGNLLTGRDAFFPCTPHGVVQMLTRSGVTTEGADIVVVGRSDLVGKPLANLLIRKAPGGNATVTVCHSRSRDIARHTRAADIVVVAAGQRDLVTADMIREGAVVIDVGVNRIPDESRKSGFRLVGDVDFDAIKEKASLITPVPGGVGPMTITMLLYNTVESARRRAARG